MNLKKKYHLTIEDESSLEKKINFSARITWFIIGMVVIVFLAGICGTFIFVSSPMKKFLPGYLKDSERTATEEQHLRLDSLVHVYEINEAYVNGILNALNPSEETPNHRIRQRHSPLSVDSLLPASEEERQFMENIREREKYNIAYASPAAARNMLFGTVGKSAVISEDSKGKYQAEIILPIGSPVTAIAEGKVISVASSPKASGGYEIIIQHSKGFLSKSSRLSDLLVRPGDRVAAGQIIATSSSRQGAKANHMTIELWHDGDPLIPSRYLNSGL